MSAANAAVADGATKPAATIVLMKFMVVSIQGSEAPSAPDRAPRAAPLGAVGCAFTKVSSQLDDTAKRLKSLEYQVEAAVFAWGKQAVKTAPCLGTLSIKSRPR